MNILDADNMTSANPKTYCSDCGYRADQHPIQTSFERCFRKFDASDRYLPESVLDSYFQGEMDTDLGYVVDANDIPFIRYEGSGVEDKPSWWDEFESDFFRDDVKVGSSLERFVDREPDMVTVTLDQYRSGKRPKVEQPTDVRNVYVENTEGFLTQQVWDEHKTRMLHARMLNVFRSKGQLRCGSIAIKHNVDQTVTVMCVKCDLKHTFDFTRVTEATPVPYSIEHNTRHSMEEFTLSVIRHGNNHAANWLRLAKNHTLECAAQKIEDGPYLAQRQNSACDDPRCSPRWYKIHTENCDGTCHPADARCTSTVSPQESAERKHRIALTNADAKRRAKLNFILNK